MSNEQHGSTDATTLRADIKQWEKEFLAANGRKAERADIKNDAAVQAKYKQYNKLTRKASSTNTLAPSAATPKKSTRYSEAHDVLRERPKNAIATTPKKTPSQPKHITNLAPALSPVPEVAPTPQFIRDALGPTPQKDGQVLGIFDIVSTGTPADREVGTGLGMDTVIAATPSKGTHTSSETPFSRTPQSVGKRYFLDSFAGTPLKRKREDDVGTTSSSKRKFATPSFLRRSFPLAAINEDSSETTTARPPFRRKQGLVRSLSSIIQGLRKQENKEADDEWDIMNEIEAEERGEKPTNKVPEILVEDSHATEMPLGPDQAPVSEAEDSDGGETGFVRRPWKKKGLKRQTRRTNMRPVMHKAKKADEYDSSGGDDDAVAETQLPDVDEEEDEHEDGHPDLDGDEATATKQKAKKSIHAQGKTNGKEKDEEKAKKPRKVNPDAHANYRRLNIKNKNSKAKGRGRFGRR